MKLCLRLLVTLLVAAYPALPNAAHADVNDFSFDSFDARYELFLNAAAGDRVDMLVTETLVAEFPQIDQNRGIRRDIPSRSYGNYPGLIEVESVTDELGKPRDFEVTSDGEFVSIVSKPADDSFVYGRQTYVIKYRQAWVVRSYQETSGLDEFYWDVNGTGWLQSFNRVSATVSLDSRLAAIVQPQKAACYQGLAGSSATCDFANVSDFKFIYVANNLQAGENLTIDVPFSAGVINTNGPQVFGTLTWYLFLAGFGLVLCILLWALYFRTFKIRSSARDQFVIPQYLPAKEPGLLATGLIAKKTRFIFQALVVELAINKQIEIEQLAGADQEFLLRRTSRASDHALLSALGLTEPGSAVEIGQKSNKAESAELATRLSALLTNERARVNSEGFYLKRALRLPALVYILALLSFGFWFVAGAHLDSDTEAGFIAAPILAFLPFTFTFWMLLSKRAYSAKGSEVANYLRGLELYIRLAEKDRLEFLQSPKGAELRPSELTGRQVLKLYESVLPWAILLGLQKQWSKVLAGLYQQNGSPVWFVGPALTQDTFSNLNSSLAGSLAVSSSSGSSGGGSSGGGGGGGGGGGV